MIISLIAALSRNHVIGHNNQLPWHLPADLKHFKQLTLGKPVVMGRKTFDSIGKPLPGRQNIVVSKQVDLVIPGCLVTHSLAQALAAAQGPEVMIIGGATLYKEALTQAQRMYLTLVQHDFTGDAYFPHWDEEKWREVSRMECQADDANPYDYSFITLERISSA